MYFDQSFFLFPLFRQEILVLNDAVDKREDDWDDNDDSSSIYVRLGSLNGY